MKSPTFVRLLQGRGINSRCAIETKPSSLTGVSELLKSSASGDYSLPKKIDRRKWVSKWRVTHHAIPRLTLAWCVLDIVLEVELAEQFARFAPRDVQLMPIELDWGKRKPRKDIRYCYVNIHREIDCVNVRQTKVISASDPDVLRMEDSDNTLVLDPNRIPKGVLAFHPKYLCNEIVVSHKIGATLMKLAPGAFECQPIKMLREDTRFRNALIGALLEKVNVEFASSRTASGFISPDAIAKALTVKLPSRVQVHFKTLPEIDAEVEVFDGAVAVEETQRLRALKELVWPKHLVCISEDGRGGYFALDLSKIKDGDCPVVYFDHELAEIDKKTGKIVPQFELAAKTFDAWVKRLKRGGSAMA